MNEYLELLDVNRQTVFHIHIKDIINKEFLEDVSICMKQVTQDMIKINEFSKEALHLINNEGWLFKDFIDKMLIHAHRVELVDKLPEIQVRITQNGIETSGDVITWNKSDL